MDLFEQVTHSFVDVVKGVAGEQWSDSGLGVWDVRALVGHTSRALTTVVEYGSAPPADNAMFHTTIDYFVVLANAKARDNTGAGDQQIAERGVEAGAALGTDPVGYVQQLAERALAIARSTPPDQLVPTRFGGMPMDQYLGTRVFELVVHSLDIVRATGQSLELVPAEGVRYALSIASEVVGRTEGATDLLLAITGRAPLPLDFTIT